MNPIRPLLRSARPLASASRLALPSGPSVCRMHMQRRGLASPTTPNQASVSDIHPGVKTEARQDPGEYEEGETVAGEGEGGEGECRSILCGMATSRLWALWAGGSVLTHFVEMFGFKLNPVATKTGGNAKISGRPIYLDMQATTPMDPRVLDRMLPLMTEQYGNPHSRTHAYGWEAESAVDEARQHVASLIGAQEKDVVFTSGATESNNMIIKGIARFHEGKRRHIITTQTVSQMGRAKGPSADWAGTQVRAGLVPVPIDTRIRCDVSARPDQRSHLSR